MAWTTPLTAVSNATLTAAQWNASVRDNLLTTFPALATAAGQMAISTGVNAIAIRVPTGATVATSSTTGSTTYGNLAAGAVGPIVGPINTGTSAFVFVTSAVNNSNAGASGRAGFAVSGATTLAAGDSTALIHISAVANAGIRATCITKIDTLTAGANTFTMQYKVDAGTGTFNDRHLSVIPL